MQVKQQIMALMMDGRERTSNDVAMKIKMPPDVVKVEMYNLGLNNQLLSDRVKGVTAYRLPVSKK